MARSINVFGFTFSALVFLLSQTIMVHAQDNTSIGALGTLWPQSGVLHFNGTPGTSIATLEVRANQQVTKGTVLAYLSNRALLEVDLQAIKNEYDILLTTHEHNMALLTLERDNNRLHFNRANTSLKQYLALSKNAQVTTVREQRQNSVQDAKYAMRVSEAEMAKTLASFDLNKKKLELQIEQAELNLKSAAIVAPFDGVVLDVPGKVGAPSAAGVVVFADISQMMVKCEVYEGDLGKIKIGQNASISGKSLAQEIEGEVVQVGREIDVARKVAIVWVRLKNSHEAGKYIGMEVNVSIKP